MSGAAFTHAEEQQRQRACCSGPTPNTESSPLKSCFLTPPPPLLHVQITSVSKYTGKTGRRLLLEVY